MRTFLLISFIVLSHLSFAQCDCPPCGPQPGSPTGPGRPQGPGGPGNNGGPHGGGGKEPYGPKLPSPGKDFDWPIAHAVDPNDIQGPKGVGSKRWMAAKDEFSFTIHYENDPTFANGPAQKVIINFPIDPRFDINSLRVGSFGFGTHIFEVPPNSPTYYNRLDVRDSLGVYVDVLAGINVTDNEAIWVFQSIDPLTGLEPENALLGFLPVRDTAINRFNDNNQTPGEGFVTFTIKPKPGVMTGDTANAKASIIFDLNAPLLTNVERHTLDAAPPVSTITGVRPTSPQDILLTFAGTDDPGGVGIEKYDLYVKEDSLAYFSYATGLSGPTFRFTGKQGSSYKFFTLATDSVGNREALKTNPDAVTRVTAQDNRPPVIAYNGSAVSELSRSICASAPQQLCLQVTDTNQNLSNVAVAAGAMAGSAQVQKVGGQYCLQYAPPARYVAKDSLQILACDSLGECDTLTVRFRFLPPTLATISPATPQVTCGDSVTFQANADTSLTYRWFRDGVVIAGAISRTYKTNQAGSYFAEVADSCSSDTSAHVQFRITTVPRPTVALSGNARFCQGDSLTLTSSALAGNRWSTGDTTQAIVVRASGTFSVQTTNGICASPISDTVTVSVDSVPQTPSVTRSGPASLCPGDTAYLLSSRQAGNRWSTGDTTQRLLITTPGSYAVQAVAGACASPASVPAVIDARPAAPAPVIRASGPPRICAGDSVRLTSSAASANLWSTGDTTQSIIVTTPGTYSVFARPDTGCRSASSSPTVVMQKPVAQTPVIAPARDTSLCPGDSLLLTSSATAGNLWSTGDTTRTLVVRGGGSFSVRVLGDSVKCASPLSNTLTIGVTPQPTGTFTVTLQGDSAVLFADDSLASYQWTLNGSIITAANGRRLVIRQSGSYGLQVQVGGGSLCSAGSAQTVTITASRPGQAAFSSSLYPNPTHDLIYLTLTGSAPALQARLLDVKGVVVKQVALPASAHGGTYPIKLKSLPAGLYLLLLSDNNDTIRLHRVVIE